MEIDFTRLRYFVAVAEELHFRRAADRLLITPPPLSKQIRLLENELGGQLFVRSYHEVQLTPLGEALLGPAQEILRQVDEFRDTAARLTNSAAPVRIGATAYAPSDFLELFSTVVGRLPVASTFQVLASAAEVTAKLVSGHLDLGLIILPATDPRVRYRIVAEYQGGIAVRADDPLANRHLVAIEELRDRQVVIDIARPNPVVLAALARRLTERGASQIVRVDAGHGSEIQIAAQVFSQRLVAVVAYAPASLVGRMFSPPQFALVPLDESTWGPSQVALAWNPQRLKHLPELEQLVDEIAGQLGPVRRSP